MTVEVNGVSRTRPTRWMLGVVLLLLALGFGGYAFVSSLNTTDEKAVEAEDRSMVNRRVLNDVAERQHERCQDNNLHIRRTNALARVLAASIRTAIRRDEATDTPASQRSAREHRGRLRSLKSVPLADCSKLLGAP